MYIFIDKNVIKTLKIRKKSKDQVKNLKIGLKPYFFYAMFFVFFILELFFGVFYYFVFSSVFSKEKTIKTIKTLKTPKNIRNIKIEKLRVNPAFLRFLFLKPA